MKEFNETLDICQIDDLPVQEVESEESEPEEPLRIEFKWSKMSKPSYSENENEYNTPWDIFKNYKRRIDKRKQSILKVQKNINEGLVPVSEIESDRVLWPIWVIAVCRGKLFFRANAIKLNWNQNKSK